MKNFDTAHGGIRKCSPGSYDGHEAALRELADSEINCRGIYIRGLKFVNWKGQSQKVFEFSLLDERLECSATALPPTLAALFFNIDPFGKGIGDSHD